ncbi:MAG: ribosome maturation factor RimM [Duncaniella sp.]|nr:ribosome maturation factor RimM [Duncaniella sp.]
MILESEIIEAGKFNKPHGIKGEISVTIDLDVDLECVRCIIIPVDGIYVPFFIENVRPKNGETFLVTLDGVNNEEKAQYFANRAFYILATDLPDENDEDSDEDGFYAADLIGYTLEDVTAGKIGIVTDINDSTQNVLFIITTDNGSEVFVPVVDEFITNIDPDKKLICTSLPEGIIDLNN